MNERNHSGDVVEYTKILRSYLPQHQHVAVARLGGHTNLSRGSDAISHMLVDREMVAMQMLRWTCICDGELLSGLGDIKERLLSYTRTYIHKQSTSL